MITSGRPSSRVLSVEGTFAQCCASGMTSLQERHAASAVNGKIALSVCLRADKLTWTLLCEQGLIRVWKGTMTLCRVQASMMLALRALS